MAIDPIQLLNQLASVGRIGGIGPGSGSRTASVDQASFAELLNQARDGTLSTKTPVTIRPDASVSLTDDQLARLSVAADRAEAAGLRNALILIDGQRLTLDVHARQITGVATEENGVVAGVDGVLDLGNLGASNDLAGNLASFTGRPATGMVENTSLVNLLKALATG